MGWAPVLSWGFLTFQDTRESSFFKSWLRAYPLAIHQPPVTSEYKIILSKKRVSFVKKIGMHKKASLKASLQILFLSICLLWGYSAQAIDILVVTESLPPYSYQDGDVVKGMATEVVQVVLNEVGIQADIHVYSWTRACLLALTKPNVLIYSISRIPEREELFQWIGEVAPQGSYLFKLASRRDIQLNTLDDAKAYRVGTWRDDVPEQYLIGKGFVRGKHLADRRGSRPRLDH